MAVKILQQKPLGPVEKTYLPGIVVGLWVTLKNMFKKPVTLEYPDKKTVLPPHYRGMPVLVQNAEGRTKCVSCQLCEFVCPPKAIRIVPSEIPPGQATSHIEKTPKEFEINMLRCIYCGLCEEVCPEEAIFLQDTYSHNGLTRTEMIFKKEKLLEMGGKQEDFHKKWEKKLSAAKGTEGAHGH